jgi:hypothetical protein
LRPIQDFFQFIQLLSNARAKAPGRRQEKGRPLQDENMRGIVEIYAHDARARRQHNLHCLALAQEILYSQVYQFYAELFDFEPLMWRRFQVTGDILLARFCYIVILTVLKIWNLFLVSGSGPTERAEPA